MINYNEWPGWPVFEDDATNGAKVEKYKSQLAEAAGRRSALSTADHESRVAVEAAQIEVLKGSLDRARDSAKTVQTAATGIATLYTGLAALAFNVDKDKALPLRGVIPVVFLGAAIVFASAFLAWFGPSPQVGPFPTAADAIGTRVERVKWLGNWMTLSVLGKAWTLRLATLCLAGGLIFLPAAFVPVSSSSHAAKKAEVATSSSPEWPSLPSVDTAAARILFKAQVTEAAKARADAASASTGTPAGGFKIPELAIWIAAGLYLLISASVVNQQQTTGDLHKAMIEGGAAPPADDENDDENENEDSQPSG